MARHPDFCIKFSSYFKCKEIFRLHRPDSVTDRENFLRYGWLNTSIEMDKQYSLLTLKTFGMFSSFFEKLEK